MNLTLLHGEGLKTALTEHSPDKPTLTESLLATDRRRVLQLLEISSANRVNLARCLNTLFGAEDGAAMSNFRGFRKRFNDCAKDVGCSVAFAVDTETRTKADERYCWFTGRDLAETRAEEQSHARTAELLRLPSLTAHQASVVINSEGVENTSSVDFAIVVPLKEEFDAIYGDIVPGGSMIPLNDSGQCAFVFPLGSLTGCISFAGAMGPQPMSHLARSVLQRFKPRIIVLIGIAGALENSLSLGDVVIATMADDYLRMAKSYPAGSSNYDLALAGESFRTTASIVKQMENWSVGTDRASWQAACEAEASTIQMARAVRKLVAVRPIVYPGHIATGNIVGTAKPFSDWLLQRDRKYAALDMEGAGMLEAVAEFSPHTSTIVLRGISDFADKRKANFDKIGAGQIRRLAMRNAARLLFRFLPIILSNHPSADDNSSVQTAELILAQLVEDNNIYQSNEAYEIELDKIASVANPDTYQGKIAAVDYIVKWMIEGQTPFLAVLGEYGIGKTTTLKQATATLLQNRKGNPALPLPIFIDLRENYLSNDPARPLPLLEEILDESIRRNWMQGAQTLQPKDLLRLVREEGAVLIFDGLDEKIVHLDDKQAQGFIRELWKALPSYGPNRENVGQRCGKLIISCRSHVFPTLKAQNSMLCGEMREGIKTSDYRACILLPFSEKQIQAYLRDVVGEDAYDSAWKLIQSVHNLADLARRPYLLNLIAQNIGRLEARRARGEKINAAALYEEMIGDWLQRDAGKHKFSEAHKRQLMEDLAVAFWIEGAREWPWSKVENWLENYYALRPVWQARYQKLDFGLLLEDLRTSTFILRPDHIAEHFRFAHTSLQEFFIASKLYRSLFEGKQECWSLPTVSDEIYNFVGQLLLNRPVAPVLRTWESILGSNSVSAGRNAFLFWLHALKNGWPQPQPSHVNLPGIDLEARSIFATREKPLNLRGANLSGAKLTRSRWAHIDFTGADLTNCEAQHTEFSFVEASDALLSGADFGGITWRFGSAERVRFENVNLKGCQILGVLGQRDLAGESEKWIGSLRNNRESNAVLGSINAGNMSIADCDWSPTTSRLVACGNGFIVVWHDCSGRYLWKRRLTTSEIHCCKWSPDGARILYGLGDGKLNVCDAETGEILLELNGHLDGIMDCAWSPDGAFVASASVDTTLKIWNAKDGKCLFTLNGHLGYVTACDWSPNQMEVLSCSEDKTLRVWDATSGECRLEIQAHSSEVNSCRWSPDGARLLSGSGDGSLKVWDAASGAILLTSMTTPDNRKSMVCYHSLSRQTIEHRSKGVSCCVWSPDGTRFISTSLGGSTCIWSAKTGACDFSVESFGQGIWSCAWSPDGQIVLLSDRWGTLSLWKATDGRCLAILNRWQNNISCGTWSSDGLSVLSGSNEGTVGTWDTSTGRYRSLFKGRFGSSTFCTWSAAANGIVTEGGDIAFILWDAETGRVIREVGEQIIMPAPSGIRWSRDGSRVLAFCRDQWFGILDTLTGERVMRLETPSPYIHSSLDWSPDDRSILFGLETGGMVIFDVQTGKPAKSFFWDDERQKPISSCSWSPDGKEILAGSEDFTLRIWSISTKHWRLLTGHADAITDCRWSPDGNRVISASRDGSIRIWNALDGTCILQLRGHTAWVWSCAWSPDGNRVTSASSDNTLRIWDANSGQCLIICHQLPEGETAAVTGDEKRVLSCSTNAWRWLAWRRFDERGRLVEMLPAEAYGPLPIVK